MSADLLDAAKLIRTNAAEVLRLKEIDSAIRQVGNLFYTGSYALDLMTWNDIDMQVEISTDVDPMEAFGGIFNRIAKDSEFIEAQIIRFHGDYKPKMPRGVYLGINLNCAAFGGVWKLDIWSLEKADFEKNRQLLELLRSKLDSSTRTLILELKHAMMGREGRVPQMGSHFLYEAVLLHGLREKRAIYEYCISRGVPIKYES